MIILIPNTSCKTDEYTFQHSLIQIVWKEKDAKKDIHKCFYIFVDLFSDLCTNTDLVSKQCMFWTWLMPTNKKSFQKQTVWCSWTVWLFMMFNTVLQKFRPKASRSNSIVISFLNQVCKYMPFHNIRFWKWVN